MYMVTFCSHGPKKIYGLNEALAGATEVAEEPAKEEPKQEEPAAQPEKQHERIESLGGDTVVEGTTESQTEPAKEEPTPAPQPEREGYADQADMTEDDL